MSDTESPFRPGEEEAIFTPFDLVELARRAPVHFMGIGGAGMAPLAQLVLRAGGKVTGCDAQPGPAARALSELGAEVTEGHDPSHLEGCGALVITSAVRADHPEVQAAHRLGVPVLKRALALGGIVNRGTVVGIAGTHGKTTTTALTTSVLSSAGLDPTGLVGGRVAGWGGNLRAGGNRLFVVEADEYDRSFLTLRPFIAVVTTLEADHLDIYGSLAAVEDAFLEFVGMVPAEGAVIGCADDAGAGRLAARAAALGLPVVTYGTSAGATLRAEEVRFDGEGSSFGVREGGEMLGRATLRAPGMHNVRNALAAAAVARRLGASWEEIAAGLQAYGGVDRRFERVGEAGGVVLVDDYAHHPTELSATLSAARGAYPDRRIVAVFQPHLYSRTRDFSREFGEALALADLAFVTDVYPAREAPIPGVTGALVADATRAAGTEVEYVEERSAVPAEVARRLAPGDLCLTMGAGNLDAASREILTILQSGAD